MADHFLAGYTRQNTLNAPSESRILRDRQTAFEDALDTAAAAAAPFSSARLLVQVYNGGAMPTAPDLVYFTHPVLVTGAETEGAAGTLTVDTATTVPVVVLNGIPLADDYLVAYSAGGRWVAERIGCPVTIHVVCSGSALSGDTVTISSGSFTTSGTTDSSGNVTLSLPWPLSNPYTVAITGNSEPPFSISAVLACHNTYTYDVCGIACPIKVFGCNGSAFPYPGATVSAGGTSGTTDSAGLVTLILPSAGNYLVTVTGTPRFVSYSNTLFLSGTLTSITLTAASGYQCSTRCLQPPVDTLNVTITGIGTGTFVATGTGWGNSTIGDPLVGSSIDLGFTNQNGVTPTVVVCPGSFHLHYPGWFAIGDGHTADITE